MGNGRFDSTTYASYSDTHSLKSASRDQVFSQSKIHPDLDPSKITKARESCDSYSNPNSTPIQLYLDVTGSMGFLAERIAKDLLPKIFENLYEQMPVTDPHVAFGAIGDVRVGGHWNQAPLQVSQFEAEAIPLIEQLRQIYLEGGGGGNREESYDLAWYFSSNFTAIDSFKNRGEKGYLFTIGDEPPPALPLTSNELNKVFRKTDLTVPRSVKETLHEAEKTWKVFHFITEEGDFVRSNGIDRVVKPWNDLLGANVILVKDINNLPDIITATLKIAEGADINQVIELSANPEALKRAFSVALGTWTNER